MNELQEFDSRYAFYEDGLYDLENDIFLTKDDIRKLNNQDLLNAFRIYQDENIKHGINCEWMMIKYKGKKSHVIKVKPNHLFGKVFRMGVRDLIENGNLSKNAKSFIATMQPYLYFPTNDIVYKCANPNTEELCKIFDMGRSTLFDTLKELEDKEVIKRIKRGGQLIIYVNPFLYSAGGLVEKDVFDLFIGTKYSNANEYNDIEN